jgi:hypothetical protein
MKLPLESLPREPPYWWSTTVPALVVNHVSMTMSNSLTGWLNSHLKIAENARATVKRKQ